MLALLRYCSTHFFACAPSRLAQYCLTYWIRMCVYCIHQVSSVVLWHMTLVTSFSIELQNEAIQRRIRRHFEWESPSHFPFVIIFSAVTDKRVLLWVLCRTMKTLTRFWYTIRYHARLEIILMLSRQVFCHLICLTSNYNSNYRCCNPLHLNTFRVATPLEISRFV